MYILMIISRKWKTRFLTLLNGHATLHILCACIALKNLDEWTVTRRTMHRNIEIVADEAHIMYKCVVQNVIHFIRSYRI